MAAGSATACIRCSPMCRSAPGPSRRSATCSCLPETNRSPTPPRPRRRSCALGAAGAAVTGIAEWSDTKDEPQPPRHACTGSSTRPRLPRTSCRSARRAAKKPKTGGWLGLAGFGLVTAGAYLGGELSLGMQLGGKHTTVPLEPPVDFEPLAPVEDFHDGETKAMTFAGVPVLVTQSGYRVQRRRCGLHAIAVRRWAMRRATAAASPVRGTVRASR